MNFWAKLALALSGLSLGLILLGGCANTNAIRVAHEGAKTVYDIGDKTYQQICRAVADRCYVQQDNDCPALTKCYNDMKSFARSVIYAQVLLQSAQQKLDKGFTEDATRLKAEAEKILDEAKDVLGKLLGVDKQ